MSVVTPVFGALALLTLGGLAAGLYLALKLWTRSDGPSG